MNKISVSTLVFYLKNKLDSDANLSSVKVSGELSNFHHHSSGHLYFTLKDDKAQISCVMFKSKALSLKFNPKNGDKVLISGSVSLFEVSGQLQIYVNSMNLDGIGDLYQRYEELKNKLFNEGYFNDNHKKAIPSKYPENIAVIVGENSAAMSDIKIQFKNRWPLCNVDYYPCLVQGNDASKDIISKLKEVDQKEYEIIILARGGGSFEDLFCFNDEELIKTIYNLKTFIVSGIGHQQDFTLTDYVVDLRAPTPTATVEYVTPSINDVLDEINENKVYLLDALKDKVNDYKKTLELYTKNKYLVNPNLLIDKVKLKLDYYDLCLANYAHKVDTLNNNINICVDNLNDKLKNRLKEKNNEIDKISLLLKSYSVDNTLKRGYSIVYKDDKLIRNKKDLRNNDKLKIRMNDGYVDAVVKE